MRLGEPVAAREFQSEREGLFKAGQPARRRGKRRTVPQIHGHRADDNFRARLVSHTHDVLQVLAKMLMHVLQSWIISAHLLFEKHLHPAPLARSARAERRQQLHDAKLFQPQRRANEREARSLPPENRPTAEGADDFVIAHVDDPHITFERRAVAGDFADDVRVNRGHGHVDDLELIAREFQFEHRLHQARQTKRRLRIAHRR